MNSNFVRAHVFISGRVQGVNFRWNTQRQARRAGLTGWVRNLRDGRVEAVFEGTKPEVEKVVTWCESGPSAARVQNVNVVYDEPTGEFAEFDITW